MLYELTRKNFKKCTNFTNFVSLFLRECLCIQDTFNIFLFVALSPDQV